jgi:hypothetical protein
VSEFTNADTLLFDRYVDFEFRIGEDIEVLTIAFVGEVRERQLRQADPPFANVTTGRRRAALRDLFVSFSEGVRA